MNARRMLVGGLILAALAAIPAVALAQSGRAPAQHRPTARATTRTTSGVPRLLQEEHTRTFVLRPKWILPTGDGSGYIGGSPNGRGNAIHWSSWGHNQARGTGTVWIEDAQLTAHPYPGKIVAKQPVNGHFTRLTAHYMKNGNREGWRMRLERSGSVYDWQPIQ